MNETSAVGLRIRGVLDLQAAPGSPVRLPFWDLRADLRQAPQAADYAEGWRNLGRADIAEAAIRAAHIRLIEEAVAALR